MKKNIEFIPGCYYHEVLKANSDRIIFNDAADRNFFIQKMGTFLLPCCELLAYVILGNHVHLLIRPHPGEILAKLSLKLQLLNLNLSAYHLDHYLNHKFNIELPPDAPLYSGTIHNQIRFCLRSLKHSYDSYLSRKYETKGVIWSRDKYTQLLPYPEDISRTIVYIHKNPVLHGMIHQPEEWQFSSIHEIMAREDKLIRSQSVIELFGSLKNFKESHLSTLDEFGRKPAKSKIKDLLQI
jgi:putative transposase